MTNQTSTTAKLLILAFFLGTFARTPGELVLWVADLPTKMDSRLAGVRETLPKSAVLGYVTDISFKDNPDEYKVNYLLSQYALVPVVIEDSQNHELILGNFAPDRPSRIISDRRLSVVSDFGRGIMLLKR